MISLCHFGPDDLKELVEKYTTHLTDKKNLLLVFTVESVNNAEYLMMCVQFRI